MGQVLHGIATTAEAILRPGQHKNALVQSRKVGAASVPSEREFKEVAMSVSRSEADQLLSAT